MWNFLLFIKPLNEKVLILALQIIHIRKAPAA